jgi:hypothetical protein
LVRPEGNDLLEVAHTLQPPGRLARRLHRREEQGDQDRDDRDHDQQFNQRKTTTAHGAHSDPP